jgi:hypothetical protein
VGIDQAGQQGDIAERLGTCRRPALRHRDDPSVLDLNPPRLQRRAVDRQHVFRRDNHWSLY